MTILVTHAGAAYALPMTYDVMICDPPYGAHVHDRALSNGTDGAGPHSRDLGFTAMNVELRTTLVNLACRAKRWSCIFSDIESVGHWQRQLTNVGLNYVRAIPWVRWSQPQLSGDRPPSGCEMVVLAHPRTHKRWAGPGSLTAFDTRSLRGAGKFSCEKPLDLMLSLVSYFALPGEVVLDPCCGSGTTGLACRLLGRDAMLLDRDAATADLAAAKCCGNLSDRDRERCKRWIEYQRAWLSTPEPNSESGRWRYAQAREDTARVENAMGAAL